MLYIILSSLILLALLDLIVRGGRVRLLKLDIKFQLFALRDELRNAAIAGEVPYNNLFDYMDTTLTRTIESLDDVNPWYAVGYLWHHKNDPTFRQAQGKLKEAFRRSENKNIADVYNKYIQELFQFLKRRHPLSLPVAAIVFAMLYPETKSTLHDSIEQEEQNLAPVFSITPQTSTFWEYSPSGSFNPDARVAEQHLALQ